MHRSDTRGMESFPQQKPDRIDGGLTPQGRLCKGPLSRGLRNNVAHQASFFSLTHTRYGKPCLPRDPHRILATEVRDRISHLLLGPKSPYKLSHHGKGRNDFDPGCLTYIAVRNYSSVRHLLLPAFRCSHPGHPGTRGQSPGRTSRSLGLRKAVRGPGARGRCPCEAEKKKASRERPLCEFRLSTVARRQSKLNGVFQN